MKKCLTFATAGLITSAMLMLCASSAMAHDHIDWSVNVGVPGYYSQPPVTYAPPPVFYEQPQPVYVERGPVVQYGEPYYGYQKRDWREQQWREQHWRERREHRRHHDEDDD